MWIQLLHIMSLLYSTQTHFCKKKCAHDYPEHSTIIGTVVEAKTVLNTYYAMSFTIQSTPWGHQVRCLIIDWFLVKMLLIIVMLLPSFPNMAPPNSAVSFKHAVINSIILLWAALTAPPPYITSTVPVINSRVALSCTNAPVNGMPHYPPPGQNQGVPRGFYRRGWT